jgi:predicted metal-binding protein
MVRGETMNLQVVPIDPSEDVVFDIRATYQCRTCSHYGKCHTCPPEIPPMEYWQKLVRSYTQGELCISIWEYTKQTFDEVRYNSAKKLHEHLIQSEKECFNKNQYWAVSLVGGSCRLCPEGCGDTCRFPQKARAAMEGAGIDVIGTCALAGYSLPKYPHPNSGGTLARVGLLLVE